jgi:anti-sigma factor RsiW
MSCGTTSDRISAAMKCREIASAIHDYVDHTLPPTGRRGVALHLAACRECRRTEKEIRCLRRLLRTVPDRTPPQTLRNNLLDKLRR